MQNKLKALFGKHHGLDEKSIDFLTRAIEKNNLPGFDYIEYKQSLNALEDMGMNEEMAFRSALATASTVGLNKEKLLKTANYYKQILAKEKEQFDAALEKQRAKRIKTEEDKVERLKKQVTEFKAKIQQLQEQMAKAEEEIGMADQKIEAAKDKIKATQANFETTLTSILNEIKRDIENIDKYL